LAFTPPQPPQCRCRRWTTCNDATPTARTHPPYLLGLASGGSEPEIEATADLIGADRRGVSTDYRTSDSNFAYVSENLVKNVPRTIAAQILIGGASLFGFTRGAVREANAAAVALAAQLRGSQS
jgi:hypothetical protein